MAGDPSEARQLDYCNAHSRVKEKGGHDRKDPHQNLLSADKLS